MKKLIKANSSSDAIFEDEFFIFKRDSGVGMHDTPWSGLEVESRGLAKKHAVEIRLNHSGRYAWDGNPLEFKYDSCYVAHGMRASMDTLDETREYIEVLEDALDFAERVNEWLYHNQG